MSSTNSKKYREFVSEPIGEKDIRDVPGIGEVFGRKLTEAGYEKAYVLLGKFLSLGKDAEKFEKWFRDLCGANANQANVTARALSTWVDANI